MHERYTREDLHQAVETVKSGGVILYPTDTVWGIGCDARNAEAVARVAAIKARPAGKSFIVLVQAFHELERLVETVPEVAHDLLEVQDSPLTVIYSGARNVADGVAAEDGTLGIRLTDDPFCVALIRQTRCPLLSTSANFSGRPTPRHFGELDSGLMERVDYTVHFRREEREAARPSAMLKIGPKGEVAVIRS